MTSAAQRLRCLPSPNEIKTDLREDLALMVHTREQMFPGVEMYSAEQIAAADAVIAAYSPEEREAAVEAAFAASASWNDEDINLGMCRPEITNQRPS
jgi:hypothetical protein